MLYTGGCLEFPESLSIEYWMKTLIVRFELWYFPWNIILYWLLEGEVGMRGGVKIFLIFFREAIQNLLLFRFLTNYLKINLEIFILLNQPISITVYLLCPENPWIQTFLTFILPELQRKFTILFLFNWQPTFTSIVSSRSQISDNPYIIAHFQVDPCILDFRTD